LVYPNLPTSKAECLWR